MKVKRVKNPIGLSSDGWRSSGSSVLKSNKPPKLRFKPGEYVNYDGDLYEIVYVYRCEPETQTWIYMLEERDSLSGGNDPLSSLAESLGAGKYTPRIVYDIFKNANDAWTFFSDIPCHGASRSAVSSKNMLNNAKIVSSGTVIK